MKRWQNKMEVFEKLLDPELYAYFKNATFYENPVFHTAHKMVDFYIEFENVIPLEIYEQIITKLQLSLHTHVKLHMHTKNSVIEMDELDRYVNYFVEKYSDVKDFRFLHPYLENDTICFSTRDESRLAALNLALPSLMEKLEDVGITQEIVCKKVEDDGYGNLDCRSRWCSDYCSSNKVIWKGCSFIEFSITTRTTGYTGI